MSHRRWFTSHIMVLSHRLQHVAIVWVSTCTDRLESPHRPFLPWLLPPIFCVPQVVVARPLLFGIQSRPSPAELFPRQAECETYTVLSGDSYQSISRTGDGTWAQHLSWNTKIDKTCSQVPMPSFWEFSAHISHLQRTLTLSWTPTSVCLTPGAVFPCRGTLRDPGKLWLLRRELFPMNVIIPIYASDESIDPLGY